MVLISELCALLEEREILLSMTCIAIIHVITCVNFCGEIVQTILCLLDREVLRGHRDYEQVVLDVKRSAKRFPPGSAYTGVMFLHVQGGPQKLYIFQHSISFEMFKMK